MGESFKEEVMTYIVVIAVIGVIICLIVWVAGGFQFLTRTQLEKDVLVVAKSAKFPTFYDSQTGKRVGSIKVSREYRGYDERTGEEYVYVVGDGQTTMFSSLSLNYQGDTRITRAILQEHRDEIRWDFKSDIQKMEDGK